MLEAIRIQDLTGLEQCANLERLYLNGNSITDISAIASLKNLQNLTLGQNQVSDITPLAQLTQLHQLDLNDNVGFPVTIHKERYLSDLKNLEKEAAINLKPIHKFKLIYLGEEK